MTVYKIIFVLVLVIQVIITENVVQYTPFHESILCRSCGYDISSTKNIISITSPTAQYSFYDSIFNGKQDVLVHVLLSYFLLLHYPLITFAESTCAGIGQWDKSSWFPGYRSRPCVCPECGALIGWQYQPIDSTLDDSDIFFGLILMNIIGETCKYVFFVWAGFVSNVLVLSAGVVRFFLVVITYLCLIIIKWWCFKRILCSAMRS